MRSEEEWSFTERARREQIVRATVDLLADSGYGATSLSAIAARIGASKGVISYHFAGKEDLLAHVVSMVLAEAAAFMTRRVESTVGPVERLRAYVTSNMQFVNEHRNEIRALSAVLAALPPGPQGQPVYAAAGDDAVVALAALIRAGQDGGQFRTFDPFVAARSLRASIDAVSELLRSEPTLDVTAYGEALLNLFEPGILA